MYTLNRLMRNVLITPEEVLFHAPTKHEFDIRVIEQSIIIAEERFIRPELGGVLYDALINAKNIEITSLNIEANQALIGEEPTLIEGDVINSFDFLSAPNKALWKQHLWKLISECVIISAFPESFIQMSSEGAFHSVPPAGLQVSSGLVTPLLSSMKWVIDKKIQDRISPLLQSLHNYICKNKTLYPFYNKDCPNFDCDGNLEDTNDKWGGICLDLYSDVDEKNNNL